jgi:hypothetical protein
VLKKQNYETVASPLIRLHSPYLNPRLLAEHVKKGRRHITERNVNFLSSNTVGSAFSRNPESVIEDYENLTQE